MTRKRIEPSEADIERAICDYLALDGWICRKMEQNFSERKRKLTGEPGMADQLCIRYANDGDPRKGRYPAETGRVYCPLAEVLWLEMKRLRGKNATKAAHHQQLWHLRERARGALTLIAGVDFPATLDGFIEHYSKSGLQRRYVALRK